MSMEWKQVGNKAETMWKCRLARQGDALYDRATWRVKWKQVGNMSETTSKCSCAWQGHAVCDRATVTEQVGNKQEQCRSGDLRGSPIDDRATVTVAWKQVGNKSETMSKCSFAWQDYAVCNRATVRASRKQVGNKSEAMSKYTFFIAGLCNSPQCHGEVTTETCRKQIGNNLQDADLHGRAMQFATGPR